MLLVWRVLQWEQLCREETEKGSTCGRYQIKHHWLTCLVQLFRCVCVFALAFPLHAATLSTCPHEDLLVFFDEVKRNMSEPRCSLLFPSLWTVFLARWRTESKEGILCARSWTVLSFNCVMIKLSPHVTAEYIANSSHLSGHINWSRHPRLISSSCYCHATHYFCTGQ